MRKTFPLIEEVPTYMSRLALQGVRFVEGNTGGEEGTPPEGQAGEAGEQSGTQDSEAQGLEAEKQRADAAEQLASERENALTEKDSEISTLTQTVSERDTTIAAKDREIWVLKALLQHPVAKEKHHLIAGNDEATILANAKLLSTPSAPQRAPGVVPLSGTGGDLTPSGGSVAAGREMFESDLPKKAGA